MGVFTGDFVFVGSTGRPDLLEEAAGVVGSADEHGRVGRPQIAADADVRCAENGTAHALDQPGIGYKVAATGLVFRNERPDVRLIIGHTLGHAFVG